MLLGILTTDELVLIGQAIERCRQARLAPFPARVIRMLRMWYGDVPTATALAVKLADQPVDEVDRLIGWLEASLTH